MSTIPPGLQPLADDLHTFGMSMTQEQWEDGAEKLAEHWAPLMFKGLLGLAELHTADEDGDCSADGDPWPCPTLTTVSRALTPPADPFTQETDPSMPRDGNRDLRGDEINKIRQDLDKRSAADVAKAERRAAKAAARDSAMQSYGDEKDRKGLFGTIFGRDS